MAKMKKVLNVYYNVNERRVVFDACVDFTKLSTEQQYDVLKLAVKEAEFLRKAARSALNSEVEAKFLQKLGMKNNKRKI